MSTSSLTDNVSLFSRDVTSFRSYMRIPIFRRPQASLRIVPVQATLFQNALPGIVFSQTASDRVEFGKFQSVFTAAYTYISE